MILYPTDRKLLSAMKRAQGDESRYVIMYTNPFCLGCDGWTHQEVNRAIESGEPVPINLSRSSYDPALKSLTEKGLVARFGGSPAYQVTHDGWCNRYLNLFESARTIVTHVLFPIIVSFFTALITVFLFD